MSNAFTFLSSAIGRKVVMALTGLLLIGFLVAHLGGNLLVFAPSPDAFNEYSEALVSNPLIYVAEAGLLVLFLAHLANGILVTVKNREARPVPYRQAARAGHTSHKSLASTTMILSGLVVLVFVPLHLWTFKFGPYYAADGAKAMRDLHRLVVEVFQDPVHVAWYVVAMGVIGFHLWHGFGSGFESLGVSYRKPLRRFGQLLAVVLSGGFAVIPILLYLMGGAP
jgi:succinate dehydrogenase / fumarate reductase cytochrome b subunit